MDNNRAKNELCLYRVNARRTNEDNSCYLDDALETEEKKEIALVNKEYKTG